MDHTVSCLWQLFSPFSVFYVSRFHSFTRDAAALLGRKSLPYFLFKNPPSYKRRPQINAAFGKGEVK